jgi:ABC-type bacteriocin/lantibiotic exporter with double-glycine peptidase domain
MFIRINTEDVRLLLVDEPSSSMDPVDQYEPFQNLRQGCTSKATNVISHRFRHLNQLTDVILCMKDGQLVDQGSHAEPMGKGGDYQSSEGVSRWSMRAL